MVRSAKPLSGVALACVLVSSDIQAADTAVVNFSAQISDGTCDVQLSQSSLQFGIHKVVDFQSGNTVEMLPLTATVTCTGATTPKMSVSGSAPYSDGTIFRDPGSVATGVGFMVRQDTGNIDMGAFYNPSQAISNNVSFALSPVGSAGTPHNESFLLGLVKAGSEIVTPGAIKSTLTFTVSFD
ncbi:fimbrial protein [Enterobacter cloacae]|uniref:fimbrial protein n=1 Tax=Enterobacter cloacae TaxID=550 RepID=UPI002B202D34|nr:fimbrial protein [Enterobacter cloacae]MEA5217557.1 fimbrial protein [Enterobacter cloacae]